MKHELQAIAVIGYSILVIGFGYLFFTEDGFDATRWLLQASLFWEFVLWQIKPRLSLNRTHTEAPLYKTLGWGNRLTILRGLLIAMTGGFLLLPHGNEFNDLLPALFYTIAAILDRVDGFVARKSKQVSLLGSELDITFDAFGLVIAPLIAISLGRIDSSYLLLSAAYYIYRWGFRYRSQRGLPLFNPPSNPVRRTLAGFQMGLFAVMLWPVFNPPFTIITGVAFMLPVLFGFVVDWWVVCGWLQPRLVINLDQLSYQYFQPCLRGLLLLLLIPIASNGDFFNVLGNFAGIKLFILLASLGLILFGTAGRIGALVLLLFVGVYFDNITPTFLGASLIFTISWILLLGTGRFSLWQWDDEWVKRYDGA